MIRSIAVFFCVFVAPYYALGQTSPPFLYEYTYGVRHRGIFDDRDNRSITSIKTVPTDVIGLSDRTIIGSHDGYKAAGTLFNSQIHTVDWSGTLKIEDFYSSTSTSAWIRKDLADKYGAYGMNVAHGATWQGLLEDSASVAVSFFDVSHVESSTEGNRSESPFTYAVGTPSIAPRSRVRAITSDLIVDFFPELNAEYYRVPILGVDVGGEFVDFIRDDTSLHLRVAESCVIGCGGPSVLRGQANMISRYHMYVDGGFRPTMSVISSFADEPVVLATDGPGFRSYTVDQLLTAEPGVHTLSSTAFDADNAVNNEPGQGIVHHAWFVDGELAKSGVDNSFIWEETMLGEYGFRVEAIDDEGMLASYSFTVAVVPEPNNVTLLLFFVISIVVAMRPHDRNCL